MALEALREAVHEYQEQHVGRVAEMAGATLSRLTNGRYGSVALDAEARYLLVCAHGVRSRAAAVSGVRSRCGMASIS